VKCCIDFRLLVQFSKWSAPASVGITHESDTIIIIRSPNRDLGGLHRADIKLIESSLAYALQKGAVGARGLQDDCVKLIYSPDGNGDDGEMFVCG